MLSVTTTTPSNVPATTMPSDAESADFQPQLDDTCALLALFVRNQATNEVGARSDAEADAQKLQALKQQLADAVEKAKEAASHPGFFGFLSSVFGSDVAQIAGAVAAVAAI